MPPSLHPSLTRQLKRVGLSEEDEAPAADAWKKFLRAVNEHYRHVEEDRELLARTSELAASEVNTIRARLVSQRETLRMTLATVATALGEFGRIAGSDDEPASVPNIESAKTNTERELERLFGEDIVSQDSSGELSGVKANLVRLADELQRLLAAMAEATTIKRELEAARTLQAALLPSTDVIEFPLGQIAGASSSTAECGGDVWAVHSLAEGRTLVLLGDVTGHGLASAILAGAAKAACAMMVQMSKGVLSVEEVMGQMNTTVFETAKKHVMMTCSAAILDPVARTVTLANAGHNFTYLVRGGVCRPLVAEGPPLGAGPVATYVPTSVTLESNDTLVWFTDGVIETENEWEEQFSEKRLRAVCQRFARDGAVKMRDGIFEVLSGFRQGHPQNDDVTVVVATIR